MLGEKRLLAPLRKVTFILSKIGDFRQGKLAPLKTKMPFM
jgi:hypothetical protein